MKKSLVKINDHIINLDEIESIGPIISINPDRYCFSIYSRSKIGSSYQLREVCAPEGTMQEVSRQRQRLLGVIFMKGKRIKIKKN